MTTITVNLSDAEYKALTFAANSPEEWAQNIVSERARIAINEIVSLYTSNALEEEIQIPTTKEALIDDAFARGWIVAAADVQPPVPDIEPTVE